MTIRKVIGALALMSCMAGANAATISLVAQGDYSAVAAGDTVSFDIVADFTGEPTIGGGLDIMWDAGALMFQSSTGPLVGDASFSRDCDVGAGLCDDLVASDFNGLGDNFILANISFVVLDGLGAGTTTVNLLAGEQQGQVPALASPWISGIDFTTPIPVDYFGADVTGVPVPAAVWFMLSGLGALLGFGRKAA